MLWFLKDEEEINFRASSLCGLLSVMKTGVLNRMLGVGTHRGPCILSGTVPVPLWAPDDFTAICIEHREVQKSPFKHPLTLVLGESNPAGLCIFS